MTLWCFSKFREDVGQYFKINEHWYMVDELNHIIKNSILLYFFFNVYVFKQCTQRTYLMLYLVICFRWPTSETSFILALPSPSFWPMWLRCGGVVSAFKTGGEMSSSGWLEVFRPTSLPSSKDFWTW